MARRRDQHGLTLIEHGRSGKQHLVSQYDINLQNTQPQ